MHNWIPFIIYIMRVASNNAVKGLRVPVGAIYILQKAWFNIISCQFTLTIIAFDSGWYLYRTWCSKTIFLVNKFYNSIKTTIWYSITTRLMTYCWIVIILDAKFNMIVFC